MLKIRKNDNIKTEQNSEQKIEKSNQIKIEVEADLKLKEKETIKTSILKAEENKKFPTEIKKREYRLTEMKYKSKLGAKGKYILEKEKKTKLETQR